MQCWRQYKQLKSVAESDVKNARSLNQGKTADHRSQLRDSETDDPSRPGSDLEKGDSDNLDQNICGKQSEEPKSQGMMKFPIAERIPGISVKEQDGEIFFVVGPTGKEDVCDAHSWSWTSKWTTTAIIGTAGAAVGWASSIDSGALQQASADFNKSEIAQSLSTALFLIAFGAGALIAAPLSETAGRTATYIVTLALFNIFTLGSALAPSYGGLLVFRFISGFFAATPLVTFGGSTSDMWNAVQRTYVFPVCACLSFLGPFLAPLVGSWIGQSPLLSWRWVYWITLIFGGSVLLLVVLLAPETYSPLLLLWRAQHLRDATGDDRFRSEHELQNSSFWSRLRVSILRPFQLFIQEPMVVLFSLYLVIVYIILFGFLTGYTFIFGDVYGFSQGSVGLTYIGMNVGFLIAFMLIFPIHKKYVRDLEKAHQRGEKDLAPESRLWFAILGAPWLPISLFWMAWTTYASITYWSCLVATVGFGFATMAIFISTYLYLIDSYQTYAASALVGATLLRYIAAGVMVPVTIPMYKNLGVHWALTLLATLAALMTPIPFVFFKYGATVRKRSSFAG